jgi:flagellar biosynthesis/type III secretory pathway protein FliH
MVPARKEDNMSENEKTYDDGYDDGYREGYEAGEKDGYDTGYGHAEDNYANDWTMGRDEGIADMQHLILRELFYVQFEEPLTPATAIATFRDMVERLDV